MAPTPSYTPPIATPYQLAERGARLGASLIDALIGAFASFALVLPTIGFGRYLELAATSSFLVGLVGAVVGYVLFLAIHGKFLAESGQTIGKKVLGIRIANLDGGKPEFGQLAFRRYLYLLLPMIPFLGSLLVLIDVLTIFRESRRCLHDDFAGTVVVKA